jgi:RNA polymerase sigma-70 factor, ECF subfamily
MPDAAAPRGVAPAGNADCRADYELVQQLVRGDAAAWRTLVLRFERLVLARVLATARELNRPTTQDDAEDLCAEVFSRLIADNYAALKRFEGRSTLSTWLSVITRRVVARRLVSACKEPSRPGGDQPALDTLAAAAAPEPLAAMVSAETNAALAASIALLGARQQELARLHYVEGYTYREISERLNMPVNSIGPTLARIHDKLRAAMNANSEK